MAIALDADLGTFVQASASGTVSLTTTNAVSAGGFIVVAIAAFDIAATLTGVAGGGLTWTIDKQGRPPGGGGNPVAEFVAIASAQAPDGLAASTVITATWSDTTVQARIIGATSFTGVATSSPVDGTATGPTFTDTQVAPWATASYPIQSGSLLFSVCYAESTDTGSTPTSPSLEAWQTEDLSNDYGAVANYRIETHAAPYTLAGTWGAITKWTNVAVAYKAAGIPNSLHFAGPGHRRAFSPGTLVATGAFSVAAIIKRTGDELSSYAWFTRLEVPSPPHAFPLGHVDSGSGTIHSYNGSTEVSAAPAVDLPYNEWLLMGVSKAAGTVTPRYHVYRYSTDEWEHGVMGGTMPNFPAMTEVNWGAAVGGGENLVGNILIGAMWDSEVADATFETLAFEKSAWVAAAPDEAYRFDTTDIIVPLVGTGTEVDQDAETLDVGDAPAGWSEDIEAPVNLGSNSGGSTTLAITTTVGVAAGERILVAAGCRAGELTGVVDDRGNSYTIDVQGTTGIGTAAVASATVTTPIIAGDEITATFDASVANFVHARSVSGLGDLDQTDSNGQFNTTAWTSTALTTTEATELVFGCSMIAGTATSSVPTSNSEAYDATSSGNTFTAVYRLVTSTGSYAAQGTWGTASGDQHSVVASYKVAVAPAEGITFVQTFTDNADSTDTVELAVPAAGCAAGNLLIVAVQSFTDEGVLNTVEDTKGNIYTIRQQRSGSPGLNIAVADSVLDTALVFPADTITVTNNDFTSGLAAVCLEYSGVAADPFDQTTDNGQFTNSHTSGTVTTTQADELLFGFHMTLTTETWTPTGSFSVKDEQNLFGIRFISQDRIVSSVDTYASTGTTGGTENSLSIIVTYKAAGEEAQEATFIIPMRMI